jgi:hypothetical protein
MKKIFKYNIFKINKLFLRIKKNNNNFSIPNLIKGEYKEKNIYLKKLEKFFKKIIVEKKEQFINSI